MSGYTLLCVIQLVRDEILPTRWRGYRLFSVLPDWRWQTWLLIAVVIIAAAALEGAFTQNRALEKAIRRKHSIRLPTGQEYNSEIEKGKRGSLILFLCIIVLIGGAWTYGRLWGMANTIPETQLIIYLEPCSLTSDPEEPILDAELRIQNVGDTIDHAVYIRLQAPPIKHVIIDQPERVELIGGNRGWLLNPTANVELKIQELLPHEVRTVYINIVDNTPHTNKWSAYMRSDRYPTSREAVWPWTANPPNGGMYFMRVHEIQGPEQTTPH